MPPPMLRPQTIRRGTVMLLVALSCTAATETATPPTAALPAVVDPLDEIARRDKTVGVIVQLAVPPELSGKWDRRKIVREQRKLIDYLGRGAEVVTRYDELPQLALTVTPGALRRLRAYPKVTNISLNTADEPTE